jgi:hypothetical protein
MTDGRENLHYLIFYAMRGSPAYLLKSSLTRNSNFRIDWHLTPDMELLIALLIRKGISRESLRR